MEIYFITESQKRTLRRSVKPELINKDRKPNFGWNVKSKTDLYPFGRGVVGGFGVGIRPVGRHHWILRRDQRRPLGVEVVVTVRDVVHVCCTDHQLLTCPNNKNLKTLLQCFCRVQHIKLKTFFMQHTMWFNTFIIVLPVVTLRSFIFCF